MQPTDLQQLQADRKRISKEIGARKGRGEDTSEVEAQVRGIGDEISALNEKAAAMGQAVYQAAQAAQQSAGAEAPSGAAGGSDDDVVDAEIVDDDNDKH